MSLDPALRVRIETLLATNPIVLFMKGNPRAPQCGFSSKAVGALDATGVAYAHVDVLVDPGSGEQAVYDFIRKETRQRNGALALRAARELSQPIAHDELMRIAEIWVDAALRLESKDLRMMERLVMRQTGKVETANPGDSVVLSA